MEFYKYQGAGNDFLIADNRDSRISVDDGCLVYSNNQGKEIERIRIADICDRRYGIGADGVMLLGSSADFRFGFTMQYFNSDGSGGMMCGNGGRCIVAFARLMGILNLDFLAPDGPHSARVVSGTSTDAIVALGMKNVDGIQQHDHPNGFLLNTGTVHFVVPVCNIENYDVVGRGREIRLMEQFAPIGTNVNFIEPIGNTLHIRTYEKGVEDETYACGTGITAAAIVAWNMRNVLCRSFPQLNDIFAIDSSGRVSVDVMARRDRLKVEFTPTSRGAENVVLTGPAVFVGKIQTTL